MAFLHRCGGHRTQSLLATAIAVAISLSTHPPAASAQNLVPNPGLESYTALPRCNGTFADQTIALAVPWITTSDGTTDYVNLDMANPYGCYEGCAITHSGRGAARFAMGASGYTHYREYAQVTLTSPLVAGQQYAVSFYVAKCRGTTAGDIGALFTQGSIDPVYGATPAVSQSITSLGGYVRISGYFTPPAPGYDTITIGAFNIHSGNTQEDINVYALDDVDVHSCGVGLITQEPVDGADVPNGTMTLTAGVSNPGDVVSYQWQRVNPNPTDIPEGGVYTGTMTNTLTIHAGNDYCAAGYYQCVVTFPCVTLTTRQAYLSCPSPVIVYQSPDTTVTEGGKAVLTVVPAAAQLPCEGPYTYYWNDDTRHISLAEPHTNQLIFDPVTVSNAGRYSCVVTDSCGETFSQEDSLRVLHRWHGGDSSDRPKRIEAAPWLRTGAALTSWVAGGVKAEFGTNAVGGRMRVCMYDLQGKRVATLFDGELPAATSRTVSWDGRNRTGTVMRPGVYWVRATLNAFSITEKVVSVR